LSEALTERSGTVESTADSQFAVTRTVVSREGLHVNGGTMTVMLVAVLDMTGADTLSISTPLLYVELSPRLVPVMVAGCPSTSVSGITLVIVGAGPTGCPVAENVVSALALLPGKYATSC
jgi:hypothetical protein